MKESIVSIVLPKSTLELEYYTKIDLGENGYPVILLDNCIIYCKEHYTPINEKNYDYDEN